MIKEGNSLAVKNIIIIGIVFEKEGNYPKEYSAWVAAKLNLILVWINLFIRSRFDELVLILLVLAS